MNFRMKPIYIKSDSQNRSIKTGLESLKHQIFQNWNEAMK